MLSFIYVTRKFTLKTLYVLHNLQHVFRFCTEKMIDIVYTFQFVGIEKECRTKSDNNNM